MSVGAFPAYAPADIARRYISSIPQTKRAGRTLPALREFVVSARYFFNANIPGPVFFRPGIV